MQRMSIETALAAVAASEDQRFGVLLEHDALQIGFYAPRGSDPQTPHEQDEVYVIHAGHGTFQIGESEQSFAPGDVLFVPAQAEHRFVDFGDDFGAWVIFFGPSVATRAATTIPAIPHE